MNHKAHEIMAQPISDVLEQRRFLVAVIARSGAVLAQATKQSVGAQRIASVATHEQPHSLAMTFEEGHAR